MPLGLAALLLLGLALGWLLALLGLLYADVAQALPVVLNLWFLVTPVVYSPPAAYAKWFNLKSSDTAAHHHSPLAAGRSSGSGPGFWLVAGLAVLALFANWLAYRFATPHLIARSDAAFFAPDFGGPLRAAPS